MILKELKNLLDGYSDDLEIYVACETEGIICGPLDYVSIDKEYLNKEILVVSDG